MDCRSAGFFLAVACSRRRKKRSWRAAEEGEKENEQVSLRAAGSKPHRVGAVKVGQQVVFCCASSASIRVVVSLAGECKPLPLRKDRKLIFDRLGRGEFKLGVRVQAVSGYSLPPLAQDTPVFFCSLRYCF
ncbi:unnamed protein product [Prorocentrum cordatum]|uniref:Uncharacterized protein n=1 Tax=Prorocentrum cordatum TaxID=2364126 RepID=A0ABN9T056_9DINO|nr:unnamed protein product [Polarella glacialis]